MAAAFGWSGSPASYGVISGGIAFVHSTSVNRYQPDGMFNYYWVDDHINVAADIGTNCADAEQSLRYAMKTILGADAVNEDKFTPWSSRQNALGLICDTVDGTVSMPPNKIDSAYRVTFLSRGDYRSQLGRLRHVVTCVHCARPFLQRLRQQECLIHH
ncbi:hypothetical protein PF010_g15654 [Phytophthora fragariae]|uniref:Uncharacterized protein n=1 Tax=Phytophthora fragariae TaxID=53985 RepID=A0A6G0KTJ7_9STRA|nr:hypothetical protein PF010_g15654 [Phytophthora fragariae]